MEQIIFRKNVEGTIRITDIPHGALFIEHHYFNIKEFNFPFDSLQFIEFLKNQTFSVIEIGESVKNKEFFQRYMVEDKTLEENKKINEKIREEKDEQDKIAEEKRIIEKTKTEKKKADKKAKLEEKRKSKVVVIENEDIESKVSDYFSAEPAKDKLES